MSKQEGNFELTSCTFVGHIYLSLANSKATIFRISVGDCVQNPEIESIEVLQWYTIAAREQVIFVRAWCTLSAVKTIVEIIHLPLKCRHMEGLSFSGLDQSWRFPHTTNYESGRCILRRRWGLSRRQQTVHIAPDFQLSMQPIAHRLCLILPLVTMYICGRIQSFKRLIQFLLGCQRRRLAFIILLRDNMDLPTLRMYGLRRGRSWLSCHDSFSKCWCEGIFWWPLAHCFPGWWPKRLVVGSWIVILTIIVIVGYRAEVVIEILIVDRSSASPGAGWKRRRRSSAPCCHDLKRRRVISTKH